MFLVNGFKGTLRQYNRDDIDEIYDDLNYKEIQVKVCPYNGDLKINFDIDTIREATGYYQLPRWVDVRVGDQIKVDKVDTEFHTILYVKDKWLFNRIENKVIVIK